MHRWTANRGMGQTPWYQYIPLWPSERETNPCAPSPAWCDYLGQAGAMVAECLPIDPSKCQAADFGPAMTPEMRQRAIEAGDKSVAAYCRANPEMCSAYSTWALVTGKPPEPGTKPVINYTTMFLIGAAIFGVVVLAKR